MDRYYKMKNNDQMAHVMVNARFYPVRATNRITGNSIVFEHPTTPVWDWSKFDYDLITKFDYDSIDTTPNKPEVKQPETKTDSNNITMSEPMKQMMKRIFGFEITGNLEQDTQKFIEKMRSQLSQQNETEEEKSDYVPYTIEDLDDLRDMLGKQVTVTKTGSTKSKVYGNIDAIVTDDDDNVCFIIAGQVVTTDLAVKIVTTWDYDIKKEVPLGKKVS